MSCAERGLSAPFLGAVHLTYHRFTMLTLVASAVDASGRGADERDCGESRVRVQIQPRARSRASGLLQCPGAFVELCSWRLGAEYSIPTCADCFLAMCSEDLLTLNLLLLA